MINFNLRRTLTGIVIMLSGIAWGVLGGYVEALCVCALGTVVSIIGLLSDPPEVYQETEEEIDSDKYMEMCLRMGIEIDPEILQDPEQGDGRRCGSRAKQKLNKEGRYVLFQRRKK